jgi:hypothetical protein
MHHDYRFHLSYDNWLPGTLVVARHASVRRPGWSRRRALQLYCFTKGPTRRVTR